MMKGKNEGVLLERAGVEEKGYNWVEAAWLYEEAAKSFLGKKMVEEAAGACKKLGYACARAAGTAETAEEYVERNKRAIEAYKEAAKLSRRSGNRSEELECEAETLCASGAVAGSVVEGKRACSKSYELFVESSEIYSKRDDRESFARTLSRAALASSSLVTYCTDRWELEQVSRKGRDVAEKALKSASEIGNVQYLAESTFAELVIASAEIGTVSFRWHERWKEYTKKSLLRCDEGLKLAEGCDDPLVLGRITSCAGSLYCVFGFQFFKDEREQREYLDRGLGLMEKGLVFVKKAKDKSLIIFCLFWLDWWALFLGGGSRFEYVQKRIFDDLHEVVELRKIYVGLNVVWRFFANFLPTFYYANFAQRSFFTQTRGSFMLKKRLNTPKSP